MYSNKMERVWIGVGSNLLNPKHQVDQALRTLSRLPMTKCIACSSYYCSRPLGNKLQPDFLNAIVILDTMLCPELLLNYLQYIERQHGRIRGSVAWQSRTLDLDILLFGKNIINNDRLIIPHYGILHREFVVYPLIELDAGLVLPDGRILLNCVRMIARNGLTFWKN